MLIWVNDTLRSADQPVLSAADRGFTLGDGVYETLLIANGHACQIAPHLRRLRHGAGVLALGLPYSDTKLQGILRAVIKANRLDRGVARITLSRGPAQRGLLPMGTMRSSLIVTVSPDVPPDAPVDLIISGRTRRNACSPLAGIKSLNGLDNVLARMEARARGADDALLLNTTGQIAESTAATLIVRRDHRWTTPPESDGSLPGITRGILIATRQVYEASLRVSDIPSWSAAMLCNSLGVRTIRSIDGQEIGQER